MVREIQILTVSKVENAVAESLSAVLVEMVSCRKVLGVDTEDRICVVEQVGLVSFDIPRDLIVNPVMPFLMFLEVSDGTSWVVSC